MDEARFPNFAGKHDQEGIIAPAAMVAAARDEGIRVPDGVILTYQRHLLSELACRGVPRLKWPRGTYRTIYLVEQGPRAVAVVGGFGVGAPVAAMMLEEFAAFGVRQFVSIGAAGCLQPRVPFGATVVCTGAVRDEGVSHHYAPAARFARPAPGLTERLTSALTAAGTAPESGLTWTVDAPYRETMAEARHYQAEGVLTVEMEAAALFTVGQFRDVDVASAFVVSDHLLAGERWTHAFGTRALHDASAGLLDAALAVLSTP
jgi:uridine phosphorylase